MRQSQMDGIVGESLEVWARELSSVLCFSLLFATEGEVSPSLPLLYIYTRLSILQAPTHLC